MITGEGRGMVLNRIVAILFLLQAATVPVWAERNNQLANHPSPYLAMHGEDPVQWQDWGEAAQQAAIREDKLLFISSGYFSCHWCHVMQRESFSNPEVAALLNKYFIPVKVDRELNPALDARLIDFVERTRGYAGWPLNVFITPEGYPLLGLVYLPQADFTSLLQNLATQWQQRKAELKQIAAAATAELAAPQVSDSAVLPQHLGEDYVKYLLAHAFDLADELQGGFGQQNKFPSVPQLQVLLAEYQRNNIERLAVFLQLTLDNMASQGLNDQLGGGFFRYTVDPAWHIPHFEKMLYDNAQLASLYLQADTVFPHKDYQAVAYRTLDFMLRELATSEGALAASLSAVDDQGVEGGYYLWRETDLTTLLTKSELQTIKLVWGISDAPELEAGHHFIQAMSLDQAAAQMKLSLPALKTNLASAQKKLLQARAQRRLPKDSKQIAAWNGLALSALAQAVASPSGDRYRSAARQVRDYLVKVLWNGQQLQRVMTTTGPVGRAGIEDYAYVAKGLLDWAEVTGNEKDRLLALQIAQQAWQRFYGKQGWQLSEAMWLQYGTGATLLPDGVMPAPSDILIATSLRLGEEALVQQAARALNVGDTEITLGPFWHATRIGVIRQYQAMKISTSLRGAASSTSKVN
jgi:uncharacterized protein YyaL (SSP411 family)